MAHCKVLTLGMCSLFMTACANNPNLRKTQVLSSKNLEMLPPLSGSKQKIAPQQVEDRVLSIEQNPLTKPVSAMQQAVELVPSPEASVAGSFLKKRTKPEQAVELVPSPEASAAGSFLKKRSKPEQVVVEHIKLAEEKTSNGTQWKKNKNNQEQHAALLEKAVSKTSQDQQAMATPITAYEQPLDNRTQAEELILLLDAMRSSLPEELLPWVNSKGDPGAWELMAVYYTLAEMVLAGEVLAQPDIAPVLTRLAEKDAHESGAGANCDELLSLFLNEGVVEDRSQYLQKGYEKKCYFEDAISYMVHFLDPE